MDIGVKYRFRENCRCSLRKEKNVHKKIKQALLCQLHLASSIGKLPCPSTWYFYGSSCYKGSKSVSSWKAAKEDCHVSDGYLIKIDDAPENNFTKVFLQITGLTTTNEVIFPLLTITALNVINE